MDALGMALFIVVFWAWFWPEDTGKWLGKLLNAADMERRK